MQVSTQPLLDLEITLDSSPSCPSCAMCASQQQCGTCQEEFTSTQSGTSAGKPWEHSQQLVLAGGPEHCTSFLRLGWNFHRASVHAIGYGRLYLLGGRLHWQGKIYQRMNYRNCCWSLHCKSSPAGTAASIALSWEQMFQKPALQPFPDTEIQHCTF